jgi:Family of unknown function (DUF5309)
MAADVSDFLKLWTQSDQKSERMLQKFLLVGLDKIVQGQSDSLSKIGIGPPASGPVIRWMEEWGYPSQITAVLDESTMTFSGRLFGKNIDSELVRKVIREGTILERPLDGAQIKVMSLNGLSAAVSAYGGSILSDDLVETAWDIIAEAWSDYRDAEDPRSLERTFREVGTQIHAETFEIPKTRKNTKYEIVGNEVEHQISSLLEKLRRQLAYAVLRSRPFHDGSGFVYGNKTEESTMCGLCSWPLVTQSEVSNPKVYVNKGSHVLVKDDLDNLALNLWLDEQSDFNQGDWWIVCHPLISRYIHDFDISYRQTERSDTGLGFYVDHFDSKIGKSFPILPERYMRPDTLMIVNFEAAKYGYYANDRMERKEISTQGRYQRWLISFQTYGVVLRNPRANIGMIYGLEH